MRFILEQAYGLKVFLTYDKLCLFPSDFTDMAAAFREACILQYQAMTATVVSPCFALQASWRFELHRPEMAAGSHTYQADSSDTFFGISLPGSLKASASIQRGADQTEKN